MKNHVKVYYEFNRITPGDWVGCRVCGSTANDIHHIEPKGMGGRPNADTPDNLIALCRECHEKAHGNIYTKDFLKSLLSSFNL